MKVSSKVRITQKVQIMLYGLLKEPNLLNRGSRFYREEELGAGEVRWKWEKHQNTHCICIKFII